MLKPRFLVLLALLAAASPVPADEVITLRDDVLFNWRNDADPHGRHGLCGFVIQGNHASHQNPKVVWDFNIDEIFQGPAHVVGVSAGSFDVAGKQRTPRSPMTEIVFSYEGGTDPAAVQLLGTPNASNGVRGTIELARAQPLLQAFSLNKWITISVKYADGRSETLRTQGLYDGQTSGPKMTDYARCVRGDTPTSRALPIDQMTERARTAPH